MRAHQQTFWQRSVTLAVLALALWSTSVQAKNLEGMLERGASHSVLWFVSPESGDLIGRTAYQAWPAWLKAPALPSRMSHC